MSIPIHLKIFIHWQVFNCIKNFDQSKFFKTGIVTALSALSAFLSLGIRLSSPPTPPSLAAASKNRRRNVVKVTWRNFFHFPFIVLALALGSGFGLFNALYAILQPSLCANGYSNTFAGLTGALMIVTGCIASCFIGIFVDKTRLFEQTMKVCMSLASICACGLLVAILTGNSNEIWILLAISSFGACALSMYPLGLELGVETTFPAPEALSTGILILTG